MLLSLLFVLSVSGRGSHDGAENMSPVEEEATERMFGVLVQRIWYLWKLRGRARPKLEKKKKKKRHRTMNFLQTGARPVPVPFENVVPILPFFNPSSGQLHCTFKNVTYFSS